MNLIDMIVAVAAEAGADRRAVSVSELHRAFLTRFPRTTVGRSVESFAATLGFYCINMRSRFPDPANRRRPADWLKHPQFKRVARGAYMLLTDDERVRFFACVAEDHPIVYADEYNVVDLVPIEHTELPSHSGTHAIPPGWIQPPRQASPRTPLDRLSTRDRQLATREQTSELLAALRTFVEQFAQSADISFRDEPGSPHLALPVDVRGPKGSHYLLLAAVIDVGTDSNHIRPFLVQLHGRIAGGLFAVSDQHRFLVLRTIDDLQGMGMLPAWQAKRDVPRILAEANAFVEDEAKGNLDMWARQFTTPAEIVERLARRIYYQGRESNSTRKKLWMLMRWLVRPAPDLRRWSHLSPADLMVPVDRHIARVAQEIGLVSPAQAREPTWAEVETITSFAKLLFPDDPARVDYAFFMWGRSNSRRSARPAQSDSCAGLLGERRQSCPLAHLMPCSASCQ